MIQREVVGRRRRRVSHALSAVNVERRICHWSKIRGATTLIVAAPASSEALVRCGARQNCRIDPSLPITGSRHQIGASRQHCRGAAAASSRNLLDSSRGLLWLLAAIEFTA